MLEKALFFKALNLARVYTFDGLEWNSQYYNLVNFSEAVYGHDINKQITIEIDSESNEKWTSQLSISKNNSVGELYKNDKLYSDFYHEEQRKISKNIWYVGPNRNPITFEIPVGITHLKTQELEPSGSNIIQFLLEKWTSQDENWQEAEEWFKKIDERIIKLKSPLVDKQGRLETKRNDGNMEITVNLSQQGSGIQNLATVISATMFSPTNSTIIIEEPENHLHPRTIEWLVDLCNYAVQNYNKQIILVTHSFEILKPYCTDIGEYKNRGNQHVKANGNDFSLLVVDEKLGDGKISELDIKNKKFTDLRNRFKELWG